MTLETSGMDINSEPMMASNYDAIYPILTYLEGDERDHAVWELKRDLVAAIYYRACARYGAWAEVAVVAGQEQMRAIRDIQFGNQALTALGVNMKEFAHMHHQNPVTPIPLLDLLDDRAWTEVA